MSIAVSIARIVILAILTFRTLFAATPATVTNTVPPTVLLGVDVLIDSKFSELAGLRVGLLTNPSGVNSAGTTTLELFRKQKHFKLSALFAAEHGLDGKVPAGTEFKDDLDPFLKIPIYSLYGPGPVRKPTRKMLAGIDALVYDIQDTGCRSYTFIATMGQAMEACAEAGVTFVVLDRPNPLGGLRVEGPRPASEFLRRPSLVCRWDIPYVYGLTAGELALMINGEGWISKPCKLKVIPMKSWRRSLTWPETGLTWVPTSPNIPFAHSPLHYVSIGMLGEIGGVQIGNRLGMPFEIVAAPWLSATNFARAMNNRKLPGIEFKPYSTNYNRVKMQGVRVEFKEPATAPLLPLTFYFMDAIKSQAGRSLFKEAIKAGRNFDMFDKVNGTTATREALEKGVTAPDLVASWRNAEVSFRTQRFPYLLYR